MVREIRQKNLLQLTRQSIREIGYKTVGAYSVMALLFLTITVTFFLTRQSQDVRQEAATSYVNCQINPFVIDSEEQQVLTQLNQYRQKTNPQLNTVTLSSYLNRGAEWKAVDMATKNYINHTDSLGRSPFQMLLDCGYLDVARGENLGLMSNGNATTVMSAWKKSPLHNDNLLSETNGIYDTTYNWSKVGIARVYSPSSKAYYWALEFGYADDGTTGAYIPDATVSLPGTPSVNPSIPYTPQCQADGSILLAINFTPGANSTYSQVIYNVGSYNPSATAVTISSGQTIPPAGQPGFSQNSQVYYNVQSCNSAGCVVDPNGYYIANTGTCGSATPTPTRTYTPTPTFYYTPTPTRTPTPTIYYTPTPTPFISSCPQVNSDGSVNQCRTGGCLSGSTDLTSGNQACSTYLGTTAYCCTITGLCPSNNGTNTCRVGGCLAGETDYSQGNATCANYLKVTSGTASCCTAAYNPTPTPTKSPTPTPTSSCPAYGTNYRKYCSGNYLYESYANQYCTTTYTQLNYCSYGCITYDYYNAGCAAVPATPTPTPASSCPAYGTNYFTYCSGGNVMEGYASGTCQVWGGVAQTCKNGCYVNSSNVATCY